MSTATTVNGVDVDRLGETVAAIGERPSVADFRFRAVNSWIDGGLNRSSVGAFYGGGEEHGDRAFVYEADEPPVLLGRDRAANPVEYVLHALAACLTTSLVYHAAARGVTVRAVQSKLEGVLDLHGFLGMDEEVRSGFEQIDVTMTVDADGPDGVIEELVAIAQARSPVFDIVTRPVPVVVRGVAG